MAHVRGRLPWVDVGRVRFLHSLPNSDGSGKGIWSKELRRILGK